MLRLAPPPHGYDQVKTEPGKTVQKLTIPMPVWVQVGYTPRVGSMAPLGFPGTVTYGPRAEAVDLSVDGVARPFVMLIDDDQTTLGVLSALFRAKGFRVASRSESLGTTADLLKDMPSVIVLDINMPGLSGDRLAQVLRTHPATKELPIVLYSGAKVDVLELATRRAPPARYVHKSRGPQRLVREVQRFLSDLET